MKWFKSNNQKRINKAIAKYIVDCEQRGVNVDEQFIKDICNRVMYGLKEKLDYD